MTTYGIVLTLAIASSLVLAATSLTLRPLGRLQWGFGLGMIAFAAESTAALVLLGTTETPEDRLLWLRVLQVLGLLLPAVWGLFVAGLIYPSGIPLPLRWRVGLTLGGVIALGGAASIAGLQAFDVSNIPGSFYAVRLAGIGRAAIIAQLLGTVALLGGLEVCLRSSKGSGRWRIKYLVLGLAGIFLVRFYLLSQVLLFYVLMAVYLTTAAATLFLGNLVVGASLARAQLRGVELSVSRHLLYRSIVVGVLGLYLFTVGALGWVLNRFGVTEELFWGSLVVFVSALGLAAILLSEDVRWRIKRFVGRHVYRSKYDYRQEWSAFTKRMSSLISLEQLAPQLLTVVIEAVGTTKGVLYLADTRDGLYHPAAAVGFSRTVPILGADSVLPTRLRDKGAPILLGNGGGDPVHLLPDPGLAEMMKGGGVAVPLCWQGTLSGLILVGPERTGAAYTAEDLEFLATVGEQAGGAVVTARLSETLAQSREFDAFHRLTSYVIHDLKNSVSALSMLSQNALQHFDDPEFQRDAIKTLSRTVDRMKALLARLSSTPESAELRFQPVDLAALAEEATVPVKGGSRVSLVKDLAPVPPVSGDPDALLRVIQNLVANAVEALDGEGSMTVRTYDDHGMAVLSVSDTGCGIPEEFLRKSLFAPFRSTKKRGWGIGLYQAKGIVEGHGGRIEVESKEGEGTTFWMKLPAAAGRREGRGP